MSAIMNLSFVLLPLIQQRISFVIPLLCLPQPRNEQAGRSLSMTLLSTPPNGTLLATELSVFSASLRALRTV
jgi:hypothetical protein